MSNRKRKLLQQSNPAKKRRKILKPTLKPIMYINDIDTCDKSVLLSFPGIGNKTSEQIIEERNISPFKSTQDLIKRVRGCSITKMIPINARYDIRYKTRYEEEFDKIYETLRNSKADLLKFQPSDTIRIITEMSSGTRKECDNPTCDETIFFMKSKPGKSNPKYSFRLIDKQYFIYHEPNFSKSNKLYYHRVSEFGDIMYCDKCTRNLRNCENCGENVYFENDKTSYNICPKDHYITSNTQKASYWDALPSLQDKSFGYVICNKCKTCWGHRLYRMTDRAVFHLKEELEDI